MTEAIDPQVGEYLKSNPLSLAFEGKGEDERWAYGAAFLALSDSIREYLTGSELSQKIASLVEMNVIPATHSVAISKLIGLAALGDIQLTDIQPLLEKLGLGSLEAGAASREIVKILEPVTLERAGLAVPDIEERRVPPLTISTPSPQEPPRNIIDLRPPDRQAGKSQ